MSTLQKTIAFPDRYLDLLSPAVTLVVRTWVAWVFFKAGLVKIQSWSATLMLFEYEYAVPLLPPVFAAYLGTAIELLAPALLALGLMGRWPALVLFVFNIIAVISYPDMSPAGVEQHITWGLLLAALMVLGSGRWSLDSLLRRAD